MTRIIAVLPSDIFSVKFNCLLRWEHSRDELMEKNKLTVQKKLSFHEKKNNCHEIFDKGENSQTNVLWFDISISKVSFCYIQLRIYLPHWICQIKDVNRIRCNIQLSEINSALHLSLVLSLVLFRSVCLCYLPIVTL